MSVMGAVWYPYALLILLCLPPYHGHEHKEPNSFSTSYTVPQCVVNQVEIHKDEDYKQMVKEATQKISTEAKVFII